ncbi:MAG: TatD family hydrolase [Deltaproteobacteria bacterium]|nr:TatD family hydrolase [Deltaproteobacteria bacterium]
MRMIEPHIHNVSRTTDDYFNMSVSGIVACVEPSFWTGADKRAVASFEDYWEQMITHETRRAKEYGIRHYVMIGLSPKEARSPIARHVIGSMESYLERERVVGIGEIGLDLITKEEEEIFRAQLRMANERGMPVVIHSPHHNKKKGIERIISIIREEGVNKERVVIDHNTEETIEMTLGTGCWAGMTVYYTTKLSAERAVNLLTRYGTERILVNGSADWGESDPLAVPKVAMLMRKTCLFTEADIEKIAFGNPYKFLKQSPGFDLEA